MTPGRDLRVIYGNCGHTVEATKYLDDQFEELDPDICVFTEVVPNSIDEPGDGVIVSTSTDNRSCAIKVRTNGHLSIQQEASSPPISSCVHLNWGEHRLILAAIYLSPDQIDLTDFRGYLKHLFTYLRSTPSDLFMILGDFNAFTLRGHENHVLITAILVDRPTSRSSAINLDLCLLLVP